MLLVQIHWYYKLQRFFLQTATFKSLKFCIKFLLRLSAVSNWYPVHAENTVKHVHSDIGYQPAERIRRYIVCKKTYVYMYIL